MPVRNMWFEYKIESIRVFFERAFNVDDAYISNLNKDYSGDWSEDAEIDHALDMLLMYQDIVVRAGLNELNMLVELELKRLAQPLYDAQPKRRKRDRGVYRELIEEHYGLHFADLPGFQEVDTIRKMINAYKHDDGFSGDMTPIHHGLVHMEARYELDVDQIIGFVDAVREFLLALPGDRQAFPENRFKIHRSEPD